MENKWLWYWHKYSRSLWVRASLFSLLGLVTALCAAYFKHWIPPHWTTQIGVEAVDDILKIIATSMLAVSTFSLGIVISAYSSSSNSATPRATALLTRDTTAHNALSTFIGSFLFSIVGIIALKTGVYEEQGRVLLFLVTIALIVLIVSTLLRWIQYLSQLGRLGSTIDLLEAQTSESLRRRLSAPYLAGVEWPHDSPPPPSAEEVLSEHTGYVQMVDMAALHSALHAAGARAYLQAMPGQFLDPSQPLLYLVMPSPLGAEAHAELIEALRAAFVIDVRRDFELDPRFGFVVMAEVGSRALSEGINDSGTAIDIIGRSVRLFRIWLERDTLLAEHVPEFDNVHVRPLQLADLFDDYFPIIARDGAATLEVGIRLQKAFLALARAGQYELHRAAQHYASDALERAEAALPLERDRAKLREVYREVMDTPAPATPPATARSTAPLPA